MFDLTPLLEFSRSYCVQICALLVPINLLATSSTLLLLLLQRPYWLRVTSISGTLVALTLFLHVSTWWLIGVITPVTFVLLSLGSACLAINLTAIASPAPQVLALIQNTVSVRFSWTNKA
ncbi:MAG: hypothetical protein ACFB4I_19725 [Cyanophyceae cyanobacterium]